MSDPSFNTFEELTEYSTKNPNKLIVLDFKATWCGPCKAIKPFVEYLSNNYKNVDFYEIDIEDDEKANITENFEISKVPTFIYFKNGSVCTQLIGTNKEKIEDNVNEYL